MTRSLFNARDLAQPADKMQSSAIDATRTPAKTLRKLCGREQRCRDVIPRLERGALFHIVSAGEWSTHDLVRTLIDQTGPVHLWAASWSMAVHASTRVCTWRDEGLLLSINLLLDWRVKVRNPEVAAIVKSQADRVFLSSCHGKVTVLCNESWNVSIIGSANWTNNPRIEACVLQEDKTIADFHRNWIERSIAGGQPFEID